MIFLNSLNISNLANFVCSYMSLIHCGKHFSNFADSHLIYKTLQNTPSIKYCDIMRITGNFSTKNILGCGGYGTVYRGTWEQTEVGAVFLVAL